MSSSFVFANTTIQLLYRSVFVSSVELQRILNRTLPLIYIGKLFLFHSSCLGIYCLVLSVAQLLLNPVSMKQWLSGWECCFISLVTVIASSISGLDRFKLSANRVNNKQAVLNKNKIGYPKTWTIEHEQSTTIDQIKSSVKKFPENCMDW